MNVELRPVEGETLTPPEGLGGGGGEYEWRVYELITVAPQFFPYRQLCCTERAQNCV